MGVGGRSEAEARTILRGRHEGGDALFHESRIVIHGKGILKEYSLQSLSECWVCLSTLLLGRRQFTHDTAFALFTYFIFKCAFCVC